MPIQKPKQFWDSISTHPRYKEYILPGRTEQQFNAEGKAQAKWIQTFAGIGLNDVVIDYGCGVGRVTRYLGQGQCKRILGIDICAEFISKALELCRGIDAITYLTVDEASELHDLAHVVYSFMTMQHNDGPNQRLILHNIHRLLKPGRCAVIQFPIRGSPLYKGSNFVTSFTISDVEAYGDTFSRHEIISGNLVHYRDSYPDGVKNEYFLRAWK